MPKLSAPIFWSNKSISNFAAGLLDDTEYSYAQYTVCICGIVLASLGLGTNMVNICTFLMMGVEDSMAASFLSLSITDFLLSLFTCGMCVCLYLSAMEYHLGSMFEKIDPVFITLYCSVLWVITYVVNTLTTVYIALTRCMCVVRPLQFKSFFTTSKTRAAILFFYTFAIAVNIPVLATTGATERFIPYLNKTRISVLFLPKREQIKQFIYFSITTVIPLLSQIVVSICVCLMAWRLITSTKFRQKVTSAHRSEEAGSSVDKKTSGKLSGKERQVVLQVVLICVVFTVCNLPNIPMSVLGIVVPGFDFNSSQDRYFRLYSVTFILCRVTAQVNSSVNLFVYLKYNSKFRQSFRRFLKQQQNHGSMEEKKNVFQ